MKKGYTLLGTILLSLSSFSQTIFINEIHYDNIGTDVNEGVEIAGPAGTDLTGYKILFYNGSGGAKYDSVTLSGIIPNQNNGYGTINFLNSGMQNGAPDGIAFVDPTYTTVQFLSYEGSFAATDGAANGMTSTDIGLAESNSTTAVGQSMQLVGFGTAYTDFTWVIQNETRDLVNNNQSFGASVDPAVSFRHDSVWVNEGAGTVTAYVKLANPNANPTSVDVFLGAATATNGSDFTFTSPTTITFPANDTNSIAVTIPIIDDAILEPDENFVLYLQNVVNPSGGSVTGYNTNVITIIDNDTPTNPSLSFRHSGVNVSESVGSVTVYVQIAFANANPTSVDVTLGTSTATNGSDFTFTSPTTITFPANDTNSIAVNIPIIDDAIVESSEDIVLDLINATNNATISGNTSSTITITDNDAPVIPACTEPFFSEYIEGSSNNKALEIFNPTNNLIDLSDYEIRIYTNGATTPSVTYSVPYYLVPGDVYVIANGAADPAILSVSDATSSVCNFNGDDALELYKISTNEVVDVIGTVGVDPGSSWTVGTGSTQNNTLIRKPNITAGTTLWIGVGDTTWNVMPIDDFSNLGVHTSNTCATSVPLTAYPLLSADSVCYGDSIQLIARAFSGTTPYSFSWDFGGGNTSTNDTVLYAFNPGLNTVTLTVTDANMVVDDSIFTVYVGYPISKGITTSVTNLCIGDTAAISATNFNSNYSYYYVGYGGISILNISSTNGTANWTGTTPGTDTIVQYVDSANCSNSDMIIVTVNNVDTASFTVASTACEGDTLPLVATTSTGTFSGTGVFDNGNGTGWYYTMGFTGINTISYTTNGVCPITQTHDVTVNTMPMAGFTFSSNGLTTTFTNTSTNATVYAWTFGDGGTDNVMNPSYTYSVGGTYIVCLDASTNQGCSASVCDTVSTTVGIDSHNLAEFDVYPNPTSGSINISSKTSEALSVKVINLIGETVLSTTLNGKKLIDLNDLTNGTYFLVVESKSNKEVIKLIKQ